jgi:hypothetical protein
VTKTLSGASVTETFPRNRVRGKTKQAPQLIPAQDVLQVLQTDATTAAANSFAEAERRMAARIVEERQRQLAEIQKKREQEERRLQMRTRSRLDTAVGKLAKKRKREARAAFLAAPPGAFRGRREEGASASAAEPPAPRR